MKRLYTMMLSAAIAVAASAAVPTAKVAQAQLSTQGQLNQMKQNGRVISETVASRIAAEQNNKNQPRKVTSRSVEAPTSAEDLCNMSWEASYTGTLDNNSGLHSGEATFKMSGSQLTLTLPDYNQPLLVLFFPDECELAIYGTVNYGSSNGMDIKLQPWDWSTETATGNSGVFLPFNTETGEFEFPENFGWAMAAYTTGTTNLLSYFWGATAFSLKSVVPDGDYKIEASFADKEVSTDNKWTVNVTTGQDVASVKCLVLPYDVDPATFANLITLYGDEVVNGTATIDPVNNNAENETMTESGFASVLFASYDAEGNLKKTAHLGLPVIIDDEQEGWATVGTVDFVDGLFSQYYQNFSYSSKVVLQAKTDNSPVYRLVNPYAEERRFDLAGHTHSMVIDATHPDWVGIPCTFSGLDLAGDGTLAFGSFLALGHDYASATAKKLEGGKIEGNVVTFPIRTLFAHEQFYNDPGSWNYANTKTATTITLPAISLKVNVTDGETNGPLANASIKLNGTAVGTTDAEGVATIEVPFSVGYFGEVTLTIDDCETTVTLNGAENEFSYTVPAQVWKAAGEGVWNESLLHASNPYMFPAGLSWKVDVEESETTPGLFRIKPYAVENVLTEQFELDLDEESIVYINATDPDKVYTTSKSNFNPYTFCKFIGNNSENGQDGNVYGTMKDFVISFPEKAFILDDEYYGTVVLENGSSFKIALPGATAEVDKVEMAAIVGEVGGSFKVRANIAVSDTILAAPAVVWASSNPEVVAVDEAGKVSFNAAGTATVTASAKDKQLIIPFEIEAIIANALNVFPAKATGVVGNQLCLLAIHEPENTTDKNVTWETSDATVATVDETGRVELLAEGTATITARDGDLSASCELTVDKTGSLTEVASTGVVIEIVSDGINVRNAEEGASIVVYTIDGKIINGAVATEAETHITLEAGIYIVKISPDTVAKVLIK